MINNNALAKDAFKMGAFFGLIQIVITMLLYVMGVEYMVKWWATFLVFGAVIGLLIYGGLKWRKSNGNVAPYGKMFLYLWLVFIAMFAVSTIFNIILYNVIDPDLASNMKEAVIDATMSMMESFGAPEEAVEQAMVEFDTFEDKLSATGQMISAFYAFLWGAVLAAILALFLKKNEPMFDETTEEA